MISVAHVLVVSRDQTLLQTRKLILGTYFQVEAAGRVSEAEAMIARNAFDLIVLCNSLTPAECERIAGLVEHRIPRPKILVLSGPGNACIKEIADQELSSDDGPYALLKKSAEMLEFELKIKGRVTHA